MAKLKKIWLPGPTKRPKPMAPQATKTEVARRGNDLVEAVIKPKHIKPPPKDMRFNYLIDISTKWHRSHFYFSATYHCPGPNVIAPSFETGFARLEYVGENLFNLSYMRHTGQWWEIFRELSLEECLKAIQDEPHFIP